MAAPIPCIRRTRGLGDDSEEFVARARHAGMYGICLAGVVQLQRRLNELRRRLAPT
jgi:hypothetical protein